MEDNKQEPGSEDTPHIPTKEERLDKQAKEDVDEIEKWTALQKGWVQDLRTNPRYKPHFEKYIPSSVENFIDSYTTRKMFWLRYGPRQKETIENRATEYKDKAYELMWEIQQKKLFNLQCEWRAEKIQLPGVEICNDFMYWEHHIKRCPFMPPITEDEIELYRQYLLSTDYRKLGWLEQWQDYDEMKSEYEGDDDTISMPEWYMFYDMRKGTGILLTYPDVRGMKEKIYEDAARAKYREKFEREKKEHPEKYPEPDKRPYLKYYPYMESLDAFVREFEDKKTYELFVAYETESKNEEVDMELDAHSLVFDLEDITEKVPVTANADWRQALHDALHTYRQQKIAEALPAAHEEYLMRMNIGISHPGGEETEETYVQIRENYKKLIIEGRILLGEPGDLNF